MSESVEVTCGECGLSLGDQRHPGAGLALFKAHEPECDPHADYREIFGRNPEPWRIPLGALRLTLADETAPPWQLERARAECEELVRVLNAKQKPDVSQNSH